MNKDKVNQLDSNAAADSIDAKPKRIYTAPAVRSAEPLEAVAVVCEPNIPGGAGKEIGPFGGCATLGS